MDNLLPCPFCGAGEHRIDVHHYWTGMQNAILSVSLKHWCGARGFIDIKGNTEEEVITKWNTRHG